MLSITQEFVTPAAARALLDKLDPAQRRVRPTKVQAFETLLRRGEFATTHQGILVSESGTLLDGQHRLHAIVNTGIGANLFVGRGASVSMIQNVDGGTPRTDADRLGLSSCAIAVINMFTTFVRPHYTITPDLKQKVHQVAHDRIATLHGFAPTRKRNVTTAPVRAAAVLLMAYAKKRPYVLEQYRALSLQDYASMSAGVSEFNRQLMNGVQGGKATDNTQGAFMRAWFALDPERAEAQKIIIRDPAIMRERITAEIYKQFPALQV